jgi:signal peptidase II
MNKSNLISVLAFLFCVCLDLYLKISHVHGANTHFNRGFIFGSLQDLPPSLTLVTLTSFGGVLFFFYLLAIYLLSEKLYFLKTGLGLFAGGIIGNVTDRALHGGTLDFIPISFSNHVYIVFNPADFFQWIGAGILAFHILFKEKSIWYPDNQRAFRLINKKEQMTFALKFSALSLSTSLVLGIFSISFLTLTLNDLHLFNKSTVLGFGISFLAIGCLFVVVSFFSGLLISQKSAGPLYAFEKYVEDLLAGENRELKLREGDNYQHLKKVADDLKKHFDLKL